MSPYYRHIITIRPRPKNTLTTTTTLATKCFFSTNPSPSTQPPPQSLTDAARSTYKSSVRLLRKKYLQEHLTTIRLDSERASRERALIAAQKARRQREKNLRSVRNAMADRERKAARKAEWERELEETQKRRDARKERYAKARALLIAELEEEAPLWMTTPEEVEMALGTEEAIQQLWMFPNHVGAMPAEAGFWRFRCETPHVERHYAPAREVIFDLMVEEAIVESGRDDDYWTLERMERERLRKVRAKLRAMVRKAGRRALLVRQAEWMRERHGNSRIETGERTGIKVAMPASSLRVLANEKAMMEEGKKIILENPESFLEMAEGKVLGLKYDPDEYYQMFYGNSATAHVPKSKKEKQLIELEKEKAKKQQGQKPKGAAAAANAKADDPEFAKMMEELEDKVYEPEVVKADDKDPPLLNADDYQWMMEQFDKKIKNIQDWERADKQSSTGSSNAADDDEEEELVEEDLSAIMSDVPESDLTIQNALEIMSTLTPDQRETLHHIDFAKLFESGSFSFKDGIKMIESVCLEGTRLTEKQIKTVLMVEFMLGKDEDVRREVLSAQNDDGVKIGETTATTTTTTEEATEDELKAVGGTSDLKDDEIETSDDSSSTTDDGDGDSDETKKNEESDDSKKD